MNHSSAFLTFLELPSTLTKGTQTVKCEKRHLGSELHISVSNSLSHTWRGGPNVIYGGTVGWSVVLL